MNLLKQFSTVEIKEQNETYEKNNYPEHITSIYTPMIEYLDPKKKNGNSLFIVSNEKVFNENRVRVPRVLYGLSKLGKIYLEDDSKIMWNLFNIDKKAYENIVLIEAFSISFKGGDIKSKQFLLLTTISILIYNETQNKVFLRIDFNRMDKIKKLINKQLYLSYNMQKDEFRVSLMNNLSNINYSLFIIERRKSYNY